MRGVKLFLWLFLLFSSTVNARYERSEKARAIFKLMHPCPANGEDHGSCPGYIIDHVKPLACGGEDAPSNMQWQTVEAAKDKDKWERDSCQIPSEPVDNTYHLGPRGGCYKLTASGRKRYVDRGLCAGVL